MPKPFKLKEIPTMHMNLMFINAVGDGIVTRLYGINSFRAVKIQLKNILKQAKQINAIIYDDYQSLKEGLETNRPVILLAIEGGDFLNEKLERVKEIYDIGVRAMTLVHSVDNCIGYSTLNLKNLVNGKKSLPSKKTGRIHPFGLDVIHKMNALNMLIDIAHSCEETAFDIVRESNQPIIASHTGALKLQPGFPRYISDELIHEIGNRKGIIGIWPYNYKQFGTSTRKDLALHANHIGTLIGYRQIAIGTDINGLPGIMGDFDYHKDFNSISEDLVNIGIQTNDAQKIMGENITSFLANFN